MSEHYCLGITEIPAEPACTSLPQAWSRPRQSSICPQPVMASYFAKSETDRNGRKRPPVSCTLYDASRAVPKMFSSAHVSDYTSKLADNKLRI